MKYKLFALAILGFAFTVSHAQAQEFFPRDRGHHDFFGGRNDGRDFNGRGGFNDSRFDFFGGHSEARHEFHEARIEFHEARQEERAAEHALQQAFVYQAVARADREAAHAAAENGNFRLAVRELQAANRVERLARFEFANYRQDEREARRDIRRGRYDIREARYDERHHHFPPAPPHHHHGGSPD